MNDIPVIIVEGNSTLGIFQDDTNPVYFFWQKSEIQKAFAFVEAGNYLHSLTIICEDAKEVRKKLFSGYKKIIAAGGCIYNNKKEILMILRHGVWDLPKGKLEKNEKRSKAAVREVREETGVEKVEIVQKIMKTYHTYAAAENQKMLKITHWYLMRSYDDNTLIPQHEEGIETVAWHGYNELDEKLKNTYGNIRMVIDAALVMMHPL